MSAHQTSEVKRAVRDRYARAATESTSCCEPACCGDGASADEMSRAIAEDSLKASVENMRKAGVTLAA